MQTETHTTAPMKSLSVGTVPSHHTQFLTFTIGEEEYAVDIMRVREVKAWSDTTRLPNTPEYVRGVLNLRGIIIPIFDLRARFSEALTEATPKHVVVILSVGERTIGLLVDTVSDILTVMADEIKPPPTMETLVEQRFVEGLIAVDERMVVVLNMNTLFHQDAMEITEKSSLASA